jgi:taurine dioxygenase
LPAIDGLPPAESDEILEILIEQQMRDGYLYEFQWSARSVLMWDNIGTLHNAVADYGPHEPRHMRRCQVMATRYYGEGGAFDPIVAR